MIDLSENLIWLGALAIVMSLMLYGYAAVRGREHTPASEKPHSVYPDCFRRIWAEVLMTGGVAALLGIFIRLALPPVSCSVFFLSGAASSLAAALILIFFSGSAAHRAPSVASVLHSAGFIFIVGLTVFGLSILNSLIPNDEPESWFFFGLGVSAIYLTRQSASKKPESALEQPVPPVIEHSPHLTDALFDFYTSAMLSFCVLMAMGYFIEGEIEEWSQIPFMLAGAGLIVSVTALCLHWLLKGRGKRWIIGLAAILFSVAVWHAVHEVMTDVPSQALADAGLLDRVGPFWAVAVGMVTVFLMKALFFHYCQSAEPTYLFGKTEGLFLAIFFPGMAAWISYLLAGFYGIALSAAGATVALGLIFPYAGGSLKAGNLFQMQAPEAIRGYALMGSFPVACGALALLVLVLNEYTDVLRMENWTMLVAPAGLGLFFPVLMERMTFESFWRRSVLPIPILMICLFSIGGFMGAPGLLGFVAGATISAFLTTSRCFWQREISGQGEVFLSAALCKTMAVAGLALTPLVFIIHRAIF